MKLTVPARHGRLIRHLPKTALIRENVCHQGLSVFEKYLADYATLDERMGRFMKVDDQRWPVAIANCGLLMMDARWLITQFVNRLDEHTAFCMTYHNGSHHVYRQSEDIRHRAYAAAIFAAYYVRES
jgi:hypothetical protein